jgi:hypothetical protein
MTGHWHFLLPLAIAALAGCGMTDSLSPAHAGVDGAVTASTGAPVPGRSIGISCDGSTALALSADSNGRYLVDLQTSSGAVTGQGGEVRCLFREPATGTARAQVDTVLGFWRGAVPMALQTVNLHEM